MRSIVIIFIFLLIASCAKTTSEKADEAIDVALSMLSHNECDEAIDVLTGIGNQPENAVYLQVLGSAYACKAGYDEIAFISNDLANITTTDAQTILTSLAKMSLSAETAADGTNYVAMRTGLNILLNSSNPPSQATRTTKFGKRKAADLGVEALLFVAVNLGKFLYYYGNVDAAGAKGQGTATTNKCFINYNDPRAQFVISGGAGGVCNSNNSGHPDIDQSTTTGKRRLCEGLMLVTNMLDILDNIDLSQSAQLSKFSDIATKIGTLRTAATAAGLGTLINMTSQSSCESALQVPSSVLDMEYLYALIFETGLQ